jgi:hypothetical protein
LEKNQKTYSKEKKPENAFQNIYLKEKNENPGIEKKHGWWKEEYSGLMSRGKNGKVKGRKETRGMGKENS